MLKENAVHDFLPLDVSFTIKLTLCCMTLRCIYTKNDAVPKTLARSTVSFGSAAPQIRKGKYLAPSTDGPRYKRLVRGKSSRRNAS